MSLQTITLEKRFTKFVLVAVALLATVAAEAGWKIDLSRRQGDIRKQELKAPMPENTQKSFFGKLFSAETPANDVVILNTEKGFLPTTVRLRKDVKYKIHIVNVNGSEKNVSFILDAFSEHHSTYYGNIKSFEVMPRKEGVFSFSCPETALEGRMVVYQPEDEPMRKPMRFPAGS